MAAPEPPWQGPEYRRLAAEIDGRAVGFVAWRQVGPEEFEIVDVATEPEFRRRGVARALLAWLGGELRGAIFLEVRQSNEAARRLYRSAGFREVGRRPGYYSDPVETAIVMNKLS